MSDSQIAAIVDMTAIVASRIPGVTSVYGAGQGLNTLPDGRAVPAALEAPAEPFSHWSDLPSAPTIEWATQEGVIQLTWDVPMRLWLLTTDYQELRKRALPFYNGYLAAFAKDRVLGGLCLRSGISSFAIGIDPPPARPDITRWGWLETHLEVLEQVRY